MACSIVSITQGTSDSFSVTVDASADAIGLIVSNSNGSNITNVTATLGGVSFTAGTSVQVDASGFFLETWGLYMLDASIPAAGAQTCVITRTGGGDTTGLVVQVVQVAGADQSAPVFASNASDGATTVASLPVPSTAFSYADGSLAVTAITAGSNRTFTYSGSWTEQWATLDSNGRDHAGATRIYVGAGTDSNTFTPNANSHLSGVSIVFAKASGGTAVLTGTITTPPLHRYTFAEDGGKTIIITLTGDTWVAAGATFDAQRQAIIDGIDAGNATANGWDEVIKAGLAVTDVVRTSATVCTVTLPVFATYAPAATQTITVTVPASAVVLAAPIVATPTITTYRGPVPSVTSGTTNGSGVLTFTISNDDPNTANGEYTETSCTVGSITPRTSNRFS